MRTLVWIALGYVLATALPRASANPDDMARLVRAVERIAHNTERCR